MTPTTLTALEEITALAREHGFTKVGPLAADPVGFDLAGLPLHYDEYTRRTERLQVASRDGVLVQWDVRLNRGVATGTTAEHLRRLLTPESA